MHTGKLRSCFLQANCRCPTQGVSSTHEDKTFTSPASVYGLLLSPKPDPAAAGHLRRKLELAVMPVDTRLWAARPCKPYQVSRIVWRVLDQSCFFPGGHENDP